MISNPHRAPAFHLVSLLPIPTMIAAVVWAMAGCAGTQEPEPTHGAASDTAGDEAACPQYAQQLCDLAGKESTTCEAARITVEVMPASACRAGLADLGHTRDKLAAGASACEALAARLCSDIGDGTEVCAMIREQTRQFEGDRCRMMDAHYDEVLAEVQRMEKMRHPLSADQQQALVQGDPPTFGPADAPVVVVAFSDFECPYCSMAADVTHKIRERYTDNVRFVFRQFPLSFHPHARQAAEASLAANAQGKFWEYHDKLFEHEGALDDGALERYAQQVGLDMGQFRTSLADSQLKARVEADIRLGEEVSVGGTPTMFINGARVPNPTDFDAVAKQIDEALSKPQS